MNFEQAPGFQKDLKRLAKKWRSLPGDIETVKQYILPLYEQRADDVEVAEYRKAFFAGKAAAILHTDASREVVKMRLDVQSMGRADKVRIVFIAVWARDTITFIEIYAKNEKNREDQGRIKQYI